MKTTITMTITTTMTMTAANDEEPDGGDAGFEDAGADAERARAHPGLYVKLPSGGYMAKETLVRLINNNLANLEGGDGCLPTDRLLRVMAQGRRRPKDAVELADGKAEEGCVGIGSNVAWPGEGSKERFGRVMNLVKGTGKGRVLYRYPVALGSDTTELVLRVLTYKFKNELPNATLQRKETTLIYDAKVTEIGFEEVLCTGTITHRKGRFWEIHANFIKTATAEGIKRRKQQPNKNKRKRS